jgi:hypothetical protein
MSKKVENTEAGVFKGIVATIMAKFKLGDAGKIQSFFEREEKKLNTSVKAHQQNISILEFNSKTRLDKLRDQLEDAQETAQDSYENITPEQVATNALQDSFSATFWNNIERAENAVKSLQEQIDAEVKNTEEAIERENKAIERFQARIAVITGA